jgi:hypothetical protein
MAIADIFSKMQLVWEENLAKILEIIEKIDEVKN